MKKKLFYLLPALGLLGFLAACDNDYKYGSPDARTRDERQELNDSVRENRQNRQDDYRENKQKWRQNMAEDRRDLTNEYKP